MQPFITTGLCLCVAFSARAQLAPPSASEILRLPANESPCFKINRLELDNADYPKDSGIAPPKPERSPAFDWVMSATAGPDGTDSPIGKCLGAQGIAVVLQRAQKHIIQKGFVTTRVLVQQQDLSSGTLTLSVLPGHVHAIRFKDAQTPHASLLNAVPVRVGDVLNLHDIEQGLENFKRVPTVEADIQIEPTPGAAATNQSDLVIDYRQPSTTRISATADDSGSANTGKYQGSATLSWDNPLGLSDLFYFTASHDLGGGDAGARGTRGHTVHYSLPMAYWTWATTYSSNRYFQQVMGKHKVLDYSGTSENTEIKLARLIYRDAARNTTLGLSAWQGKSNNFVDNTEIRVQRRVEGGWTLALNHTYALGDAQFEGGLAYKRGTGDFDSLEAPEEAFQPGSSRLGLLTLDLSATLPYKALNRNFKYEVTAHVQDNTTPLTSSNCFAIGGRYSVRGFDGESTLTGERGWRLRNDWSVALVDSAQEAYLGLDAGEVSGPSSAELVGITLSGAVLGLRGSFKNWQYDVFVGAPLYQPAGFKTAQTVAGFSLSVSL